jgi:hypothetical protein
MKVEYHTGFSAGVQTLEGVPRKGDIYHIAEFTYRVMAVERFWGEDEARLDARIWILGIPESDIQDCDVVLNGAPHALPANGDLINLGNKRVCRVMFTEWFISRDPRDPVSTRLHLKLVIRRDPGISAVTSAGNAHGQRYVRAGISPM